MQKEIELLVSAKTASDLQALKNSAADFLAINPREIHGVEILKKSIDARKIPAKMNVRLKLWIGEPMTEKDKFEPKFQNVADKKPVIIVGAGPAGLFAALKLIELGRKPILIERGKNVQERRKDIAELSRNKALNPESNYAFGEGGAGTFSDGKLYTRSKKRGNVDEVMNLLRFHGAEDEILTDAHPHIGTDKLPRIIVEIRKTIIEHGGVVHFETKLTDILIENQSVKGIITQNGDEIFADALILATGHSATDIYELLHKKNIHLEAKAFAMGVRAEHPQELIDKMQYHCELRDEHLPAAAYSQVVQVRERGVYSFCMCPGGFIVPAATSNGEIVVNGMSPSNRNSEFANSGIVVEIKTEDFPDAELHGALAGLRYREQIERMAFLNGGGGVKAPAQRMYDFVKGRLSGDLPKTSYHPGIISSPIHFWLPEAISTRLREGFKLIDKRMRGYLTNDAIVVGVETRTSSPVRIPRDNETLQHTQIRGLFPCGEGAGYAGGIVSAAVDGQRCAEATLAI